MSVTITIENNHQYVDQHCAELIKIETFEPDEFDPEGCSYKEYPFEMDLANINFAALWRALGLYTEDCFTGSMSANLLLSYLKRLRINNICREDEKEDNYFAQGIDREKATRYYWSLMQIAKEAEKRNTNVVWY